jgi:hypothetical protein
VHRWRGEGRGVQTLGTVGKWGGISGEVRVLPERVGGAVGAEQAVESAVGAEQATEGATKLPWLADRRREKCLGERYRREKVDR